MTLNPRLVQQQLLIPRTAVVKRLSSNLHCPSASRLLFPWSRTSNRRFSRFIGSSTSNGQPVQDPEIKGNRTSIVADLLDYLNESWTQFHATGDSIGFADVLCRFVLGCNSSDIKLVELNVCDTQPSCIGGGNKEFIFSGRLDNLASCYCSLRALLDSCKLPGDLADEHSIRMVALFDNEEVGSGSV